MTLRQKAESFLHVAGMVLGAAGALGAAWLCFHLVYSPAQCMDGWGSPSIGKQGACSWHGGVDEGSGVLLPLIISGYAGMFGFGLAYMSFAWLGLQVLRLFPEPLPEPPKAPMHARPKPVVQKPSASPGLKCALCGGPTRYEPSEAGFYCEGYPRCIGFFPWRIAVRAKA